MFPNPPPGRSGGRRTERFPRLAPGTAARRRRGVTSTRDFELGGIRSPIARLSRACVRARKSKMRSSAAPIGTGYDVARTCSTARLRRLKQLVEHALQLGLAAAPGAACRSFRSNGRLLHSVRPNGGRVVECGILRFRRATQSPRLGGIRGPASGEEGSRAWGRCWR
jgi:hypothetical protein